MNNKVTIVLYAKLSVWVLIANFLSRYDAITHPMNFTGSWRRARVLVIVAWILSAAFASPILHFYNTTETGHYTYRGFLVRWVITLVQYYRLPMSWNQDIFLPSTIDSNIFIKMSKFSLFSVSSFKFCANWLMQLLLSRNSKS